MDNQVFYRKWRPFDFDNIVGQNHITSTLKKAILSKRIAHAYLFTGPRGVGKTSTARILAKALNSQIKREALEMDWTRSRGHRLGDAYSNRSFITREQAIQRMLAKQEDAKSKQQNKHNKGT